MRTPGSHSTPGNHPVRRILLLAVSVLALTALATPTAANASEQTGTPVLAFAAMTGAEEVPGPGDPDGTGFAVVRVEPQQGRVCAYLFVAGIRPANAAHIHRGPVGVAGPVVVNLNPPTSGISRTCATVDRTLAEEIANDPNGFYVNVHNKEYPDGAVRGQLRR